MNIFYTIALFFLCLLVFPLVCVVGLVVFLLEGSPVLFRQLRVGKRGKIFTIYKFRTMWSDSDIQKKKLLKRNEADGPVFKIKNDPRFTSAGRFLAHTGLDELPQLWNVIIGDMALIGPRPLPIEEANKLKSWQKKRLDIKPGIISPWILQGYHTMSFDAWMKSDIEYVESKSFFSDLGICIRACKFLSMLFIKELIQ
jgi:lipopolysaccharide/colanic/teichoic acid biosynthesis glycosyltransferase